MVHHHLGKLKEAVVDYTMAIKLDPKLAMAYENRALFLYAALGDDERARADREKAYLLKLTEVNVPRCGGPKRKIGASGAVSGTVPTQNPSPRNHRPGWFPPCRFQGSATILLVTASDFGLAYRSEYRDSFLPERLVVEPGLVPGSFRRLETGARSRFFSAFGEKT